MLIQCRVDFRISGSENTGKSQVSERMSEPSKMPLARCGSILRYPGRTAEQRSCSPVRLTYCGLRLVKGFAWIPSRRSSFSEENKTTQQRSLTRQNRTYCCFHCSRHFSIETEKKKCSGQKHQATSDETWRTNQTESEQN